MSNILLKFLFIFNSILFFSSNSLLAKDVPRMSSPVIDQAGLLSGRTKQALNQALHQIKAQTGNEIAVFTVKSLENETIDGYSIKVVDEWKLGAKGKDNGVLFLISVDDKKMRIEVGRGLEGDLPDAIAGRIINSVKPFFKKGDYKSGIIYGVSQIVEKTGGKLSGAPRVRNKRAKGSYTFYIFVIFFILSMISGRGGRGGGLMSGILLGSLLGGGRHGGGFGGGGGFSGGGGFGGGGGFSGGGASGGW